MNLWLANVQQPDSRTVVLLDEDLAALLLPTRRTVNVLGFVDERPLPVGLLNLIG
ncbi:hypothetical protein ACFYWN_46700 [Streptomyces sp. NPDC002917]|uniref:hypothetical protein n=1 Tax=Streptomyces sp. NPDC002917 TaxID=3364671 RepID=UPI0036A8E1D4